jgi:peroxin-3
MSPLSSLRRRFEQNQEDCTFTVLALLPTATTNILKKMNTEEITYEIQQMKGSGKAVGATSVMTDSITPPSTTEANTDEDGRSLVSMQSDSGVHASQVALPPTSEPATDGASGAQTGGESAPPNPRKTKRQLWDDLTISCELWLSRHY